MALAVQEQMKLEKGQVLAILQSINMLNELRAPRAGKVERIKVKPGETVEQRQILLSLI